MMSESVEGEAEPYYDEELLATAPRPKRTFGYNWSSGLVSPYLATAREHLEDLKAGIDKVGLFNPTEGEKDDPEAGKTFWDLGCGDGVALIEIAKNYHVQCVGVELDAALCEKSKIFSAQSGVESLVHIRCQDLTSYNNVSSFDPKPKAVFLFLLPAALEKIRPVLEILMDQIHGLVVIVEVWAISAWEERLFHVEKQRFFFYRAATQ